MKRGLPFTILIIFFCNVSGYCQALEQTATLGNIAEEYEKIKKVSESEPNNVDAKKSFIVACAYLNKWDELLIAYSSLRGKLDRESKQNLDDIIVSIRTKALPELNYSISGQNYAATVIAPFLKYNPLEKLPKDLQKELTDSYARGWKLFQDGKFSEGESEFARTLKIQETPIPYLYVGLFLNNLGNPAEAIYNLEKAIAIAGRENVTPFLYLSLASAYKNNGDNKKAISVLKEQIKDNPHPLFLLYNLAYFYLQEGDKKGFIETCNKIKSLDYVIFVLMEGDNSLNTSAVPK